MIISQMLGQSGILTVLGMGIVFSFLIIMIFCVSAIGRVIHSIGRDKDVSEPGNLVSVPVSAAGSGTAVTAAITAAVDEYRKNNS